MAYSSLNLLLELDITLVLHERGVPRHILMVRQLSIELAMCGTVERHPLDLAISGAFIGVKESVPAGYVRNSLLYMEHFFSFEILTENPGPSTSHQQRQSRMQKPTCPYQDSTSVAWAR
jgi:hypothetical protein